MGLQWFSQSLNALFPKSLQWGQSLGGVKLLALLQYSAACTSKLQELSRANSESRCFIISPSSKSQVLKHGRNCTVLLFQISGEKLGNFNALQVWNKFSKITRPGILSLFSTPSFSWASTVSEYLLHGKAVPEYSGQPFYLCEHDICWTEHRARNFGVLLISLISLFLVCFFFSTHQLCTEERWNSNLPERSRANHGSVTSI